MKNYILFFALLLSFGSFAQIEGTWNGAIEIPLNKMPFVIYINKVNNDWNVMGGSPSETGKKFPLEKISFKNDTLKISDSKLGMNYVGVLKDAEQIQGKFSQRGMAFTLNLTKGEFKQNRPQEPKVPFGYQTEDVMFENKKAGIKLAGTMTSPKENGKYPAVILVSGSGPQDRDETIMGHKPFLVLADYLTKKGYVVLRYDDRGVAKSEGNFSDVTTSDFATDTEAAFEFLKAQKNIDKNKIGILGHSEGGTVAQIVAANNKDIDFIISLAGPGIANDKLMIIQKTGIERAMGVPEFSLKINDRVFGKIYELLKKETTDEVAEAEIKSFLNNDSIYKNVPEKDIQKVLDQVLDKWFRSSIKYDPSTNFSKIKTKVLALNGEKDLQVTAKENLEGWKNGLTHNKILTVKSYPDLNHMFQKAKTGLPNEYGTIETTIEPFVLEDIVTWLNEHVKQ